MNKGFLSKKSWHTGSLKHIEKVWIAERKHTDEQKNIEALKRELAEEQQIVDLKKLHQESSGQKKSERLDWMYEMGVTGGKSSTEDYLKGKKFEDPQQDELQQVVKKPGSLFLGTVNPAQDAEAKMRDDPLLAIKMQEQKALNRILDNPVKMKAIKEEKEMKELLKRLKKDKKKKEKDREKKRNRDRGSDSRDNKHESHFERGEYGNRDNKHESHSERGEYGNRDNKHESHSERGEHGNRRRRDEDERDRHQPDSRDSSHPSSKRHKHDDHEERRDDSHHHHRRDDDRRNGHDTKKSGDRSPEKEDKKNSSSQEKPVYTSSNPHPAYRRRPKIRSPVDQEERDRKLREMMQDADVYEKERFSRLTHNKEVEEAENKALLESTEESLNFIHEVNKDVYDGSALTLEDRVQRSKHYIQRRPADDTFVR